MYNAITRRLVKELLLRAERELTQRGFPGVAGRPVYYYSWPDRMSFTRLERVVRGMQQMGRIPWPDQGAIVIAEPVSHLLVYETGIPEGLTLAVSLQRDAEVRGEQGTVAPGELLLYITADIEQRRVKLHALWLMLVAGQTIGHATDTERLVDEYIAASAAIMPLDAGQRRRMRQYAEAVVAGSYTGLSACNATFRGNRVESELSDVNLMIAGTLLGDMANAWFPTGYLVRARLPGFGAKVFARAICGKPIFGLVRYDRVFRQSSAHGEIPAEEREAHFRRGHVRRHWGRAGIDRTTLPDDPYQRLSIALKHKVETSYVSPAWIGEREWEDEGWRYAVETERVITGTR